MEKENILEKYGDVKLTFNNYYKYTFGFSGKTQNGEEIYATIGGGSDDIYRLEVSLSKKETLKTLFADYIVVTKDGKTIAEWSNL